MAPTRKAKCEFINVQVARVMADWGEHLPAEPSAAPGSQASPDPIRREVQGVDSEETRELHAVVVLTGKTGAPPAVLPRIYAEQFCGTVGTVRVARLSWLPRNFRDFHAGTGREDLSSLRHGRKKSTIGIDGFTPLTRNSPRVGAVDALIPASVGPEGRRKASQTQASFWREIERSGKNIIIVSQRLGPSTCTCATARCGKRPGGGRTSAIPERDLVKHECNGLIDDAASI
ncbi:hypothetical protein DFH07DRAFT_766901 [Mycena maculata]|uniref:Uncharacterized protein n=1 Tax=Mycena maculata TaxID=230809 RepID=A0AAD7NUT3_9AGAR|nr:hypothetical protein DFH07DRAFT_766901 [Mycena maculata]